MGVEWVMREILAPAATLLTKQEVWQALGISEDLLDELVTTGQFPRPMLLTARQQRWRWEWVVWFVLGREIAPRLTPDGPPGNSPDLVRSAPIESDPVRKRPPRGGPPLQPDPPAVP